MNGRQPTLGLRWLKTLQVIAAEGSVSGAARTLGYTQPAVSRQIDRLEAELGTPVLMRVGRALQLTDAGRVLLAHADAILARVAAAEQDVAAIAGLRAGHVRLASFPSGGAMLVPAALALLHASHPAIKVSFTEAEPPESLPMLRRGGVDLVLAFEFKDIPADGEAYEYVPLLTEPLHAVLPRDHRLASTDQVDLVELAEETWIAGCERCRANLLQACRAVSFEPRIAMATDDYVTVQALIAAGEGVALLPALIIAAHRHLDVAIRPITNAPQRLVEVVLPAADRRPPAVGALLHALEASSSSIVAGQAGELGVERAGVAQ